MSKNLTRDILNLDFTARYTGGELRASEESTEVRFVTKEEAFQEFSLSQVNDECKKHSLELGRIVFN